MGASITLVARNEAMLDNVVHELPTTSGQHHDFIVADFVFPEVLNDAVLAYIKKNGVSVLVNNTGGPPPGPIVNAKPADFVQAFTNHLVCNHLLVQAVLPHMKKERYGRIVNIVSTSAKVPARGLGVSNTIRGAVSNWAKTLANELGQFGITVNNVLPGATMTGRLEAILKEKELLTGKAMQELKDELSAEIPAGRIGEAHEIAAAVAFLASPAASYINGVSIPVDGGRTPSL
jgi:3-oxoacyl-[acyl-carrier protein] reductase